MTTIWHNPRCSTSRATLKLLEERGIALDVRLYLQDPPTETELRAALKALDLPALALVRQKEAAFGEEDLSKASSEDELIAAMVAHPVLIERPVVLNDGRAALGRPPEAVLSLF